MPRSVPSESLPQAGPHWLYAVSGHGYGHAARSAEVATELLRLDPTLRLTILTTAPARFFAGLPRLTVTRPAAEMEAGVAEIDPLRLDVPNTVARIAAVLEQRESLTARLAEQFAALRVTSVLADTPFLAVAAATRLRLPATVISNFTWDWIYEPFLAGHPRGAEWLSEIRDAYAGAERMLRLPLGGGGTRIRCVEATPLVAPTGHRPSEQVLAELALADGDSRPRVLVATRGRLSSSTLRQAAAECANGPGPKLLLLAPRPTDPESGGAPAWDRPAGQAEPHNDWPDSVHWLPSEGGPRFRDVVGVCAAVVSKLGYGIIAECVAGKAALLYPPRVGFREDELTAAAIPAFLRARAISVEDYTAGRWGRALRELLAQPAPPERPRLDGAAVCAGRLLDGAGLPRADHPDGSPRG